MGVDEVGTVLQWVQNLDPVGIGARDLRECLLLQLKHRGPQTPHYDVAWRLVDLYLDLLASHENESLLTLLDVDAQKLSDAVRLVRTLEPRPGRSIDLRPAEYVVPDVVVRRLGGHWAVELNREALPNLRINPSYAALVRRADASETNTCLRNHLQEARWFLKSLASRNETLLKVATSIVRHQQEFLDAGDKAMKPLVLREIADEVELHESTVSRVTNRKYMHTPRGVFEFKFFFSRHLGDEGEDCSSTAIRAIIRKLVDEEPPRRPLSDSQLTRRIAEQGMHIARRTVAKYREAMNIPSSTDRKRMI